MDEDRRVRRTRGLLRDAFLSLMAEKGYEALSVQDVIRRADVGRSTFYAHYSDKSDLLQDSLAEMRSMLTVRPPAGERARPLRFSLEMLRHVADQPTLVRALLTGPATTKVLEQLEAQLVDMALADLRALPGAGAASRVPIELAARSVVASFLATMRWWVENDFAESPEAAERLFQTMNAATVRAVAAPVAGPPPPAT
jgi:AcrR family transcriptional regulator